MTSPQIKKNIFDTHLRRPVVLIVDQEGTLKSALARAPVSVRNAFSTDAARTILRRAHVSIIACSGADAVLLADAPLKSRDAEPPSFLLTDGISVHLSAQLHGRRLRGLPCPCDPRRIVAEVLALAHGWNNCTTELHTLDDKLAIIESCGLVFFNNKLVPLLRMERQVFALLAGAPGRTLTWHDLSEATGANKKHLYVSMSRMRLKFDDLSSEHRYIETQHAKGVTLVLRNTLSYDADEKPDDNMSIISKNSVEPTNR